MPGSDSPVADAGAASPSAEGSRASAEGTPRSGSAAPALPTDLASLLAVEPTFANIGSFVRTLCGALLRQEGELAELRAKDERRAAEWARMREEYGDGADTGEGTAGRQGSAPGEAGEVGGGLAAVGKRGQAAAAVAEAVEKMQTQQSIDMERIEARLAEATGAGSEQAVAVAEMRADVRALADMVCTPVLVTAEGGGGGHVAVADRTSRVRVMEEKLAASIEETRQARTMIIIICAPLKNFCPPAERLPPMPVAGARVEG